MTALLILLAYLSVLLGVGFLSHRAFRGTAADFFLASRGIGSFFLVMSLFGTTMTAFALVGSSGEAFKSGIGVYGKLASSSGILHSACFFLIGSRLWAFGKRHGYVTQIQFFRQRFESDAIGLALFPLLVGFIIPYLLIGVLSAGTVIQNVTVGAFPELFKATGGGVPSFLGSALVCVVVLLYVFFGGVRGTAWANAFQTLVFLILGTVTFLTIAHQLGGPEKATQAVLENNPTRLKRSMGEQDQEIYEKNLHTWMSQKSQSPDATLSVRKPEEPRGIPDLLFLTYLLIPLSVGMFPHVFQHWLTAKSSRGFKWAVVSQPLLILVVWVPCVLLGVWATSAVTGAGPVIPDEFQNANAVLAVMVQKLTGPILGGLLTAGILAAIMSSLDSQFLCLGSIFTNDIVAHYFGGSRFSEKRKVLIGRGFVVGVVFVTYILSLFNPRDVFSMGIWCFSGYTGLFPLIIAALYWRRVTRVGAYACILTTAVVWSILFTASDFGKERDFEFLGMLPVATIFLGSTFSLVVGSLLSRPVSRETLALFFSPRGDHRG